tara:strand:- start:58 stop:192 length:135 start_codon:yes stop_codon:yes gene_type:complete
VSWIEIEIRNNRIKYAKIGRKKNQLIVPKKIKIGIEIVNSGGAK